MRRSHVRCRPSSDSNSNSSAGAKMEPVKLQTRPNPRSRSSNLFARSSKNPRPNLCLIVASTVAIFLLLLCSYYVLVRAGDAGKYGIIIDGGSTGTRIHVLRYKLEGGRPVLRFGKAEMASLRINPGLSAHAADPRAASSSLLELLEFAKKKVPRELWKETEIRLMATAGLRLLDVPVQQRILDECREVLRTSGFKFLNKWASVITGSDEGMYAWVVANYALGTLGGDPHHTTGIIELGGASAQVTFVPREPIPPEFSRTILFRNVTYHLYSHSFLHFGQNVAFDTLKELFISGNTESAGSSVQKGMLIDPCTPNGYLSERNNDFSTLKALGNFSECRSAANFLLQREADICLYSRCYLGAAYLPKLEGNFLATENFFHTSKFFKLQPKAFLSDLMRAGKEFCGEDWSTLRKKHRTFNEEDLVPYCFSSAYIVALLHDTLGIAMDDERIESANQVGNMPLDWAFGAFILHITATMDPQHPDWIKDLTDNLLSLPYIFAISVLFMFLAWSISRWRKPQLKTVYDLEKGRYIVTRVNRN